MAERPAFAHSDLEFGSWDLDLLYSAGTVGRRRGPNHQNVCDTNRLRPGGLREVAETGVDCLSLGWLTHSARAADLALETELLP